MLPQVTGVSDLQRQTKKVLEPIRAQDNKIIMLAERNHVFGVVMSLKHYEDLMTQVIDQENDFWANASESSLEFWNHPSNDAYEKYL